MEAMVSMTVGGGGYTTEPDEGGRKARNPQNFYKRGTGFQVACREGRGVRGRPVFPERMGTVFNGIGCHRNDSESQPTSGHYSYEEAWEGKKK